MNQPQVPGTSQGGWVGVTTSADGDDVAALMCNGSVYTIQNATTSGGSGGSRPTTCTTWTAIVSDATGQKVVASKDDGSIYTNTQYGQGVWRLTDAPLGHTWVALGMDYNANHLYAAEKDGEIYRNNAFGRGEWSLTQAPSSLAWTSITSDASGKVVVATASGGEVWRNEDWGVGDWTRVTGHSQAPRPGLLVEELPVGFSSLAMDATGKNSIIAINGGGIYYNQDHGQGDFTLALAPTRALWR